MILAPLRGVTIRSFRTTFAEEIASAGFTEALTPFIPAMPGIDPLRDRELREEGGRTANAALRVTPQFIGKDPAALRDCLKRVRDAGYETADLNCGCPFPMVRNKGRGSGLLRAPDILRRMLEVGCETMGPDRFSVKARLGVVRNDELLALMPVVNEFPLRYLTVHARNARQMYGGSCDIGAFGEIRGVSKVPVVYNGDLPYPEARAPLSGVASVMVGRGFVRHLGTRDGARELLLRYLSDSQAELSGDAPVLGRMKELLAYWKELPRWRRRWDLIKVSRSVSELRTAIG